MARERAATPGNRPGRPVVPAQMRLRGVLLAVLLALGGCAGSPKPPPPGATAAPTVAASSPSAGLITLTGRVRAGVEAGCLVLRADGKDYLLLGGTAAQRAVLGGDGRVT